MNREREATETKEHYLSDFVATEISRLIYLYTGWGVNSD